MISIKRFYSSFWLIGIITIILQIATIGMILYNRDLSTRIDTTWFDNSFENNFPSSAGVYLICILSVFEIVIMLLFSLIPYIFKTKIRKWDKVIRMLILILLLLPTIPHIYFFGGTIIPEIHDGLGELAIPHGVMVISVIMYIWLMLQIFFGGNAKVNEKLKGKK